MSLSRRKISSLFSKKKKYSTVEDIQSMTPEEILNIDPKEISISKILEEDSRKNILENGQRKMLIKLKAMKDFSKEVPDFNRKEYIETKKKEYQDSVANSSLFGLENASNEIGYLRLRDRLERLNKGGKQKTNKKMKKRKLYTNKKRKNSSKTKKQIYN